MYVLIYTFNVVLYNDAYMQIDKCFALKDGLSSKNCDAQLNDKISLFSVALICYVTNQNLFSKKKKMACQNNVKNSTDRSSCTHVMYFTIKKFIINKKGT